MRWRTFTSVMAGACPSRNFGARRNEPASFGCGPKTSLRRHRPVLDSRLADFGAGNRATLSSWSVGNAEVPEPVTWALIAFGAVFGAVRLGRYFRRRFAAAD